MLCVSNCASNVCRATSAVDADICPQVCRPCFAELITAAAKAEGAAVPVAADAEESTTTAGEAAWGVPGEVPGGVLGGLFRSFGDVS